MDSLDLGLGAILTHMLGTRGRWQVMKVFPNCIVGMFAQLCRVTKNH